MPNRGVAQNVQTNNARGSRFNQSRRQRAHCAGLVGRPPNAAQTVPPFVLNEPLGSDIAQGMLYLADRDGGTTPTDKQVAVIRQFNMQTGLPSGEMRVRRQQFNDIRSGRRWDGVIRRRRVRSTKDRRQVWKITPDGKSSIFVQGAPLRQPNGIAFDPQGNIVVVNIGVGRADVLRRDGFTAHRKGRAARQTTASLCCPDGTKYVSSVQNGGVSRIRPGQPAELIARNVAERRVDVLRLGR